MRFGQFCPNNMCIEFLQSLRQHAAQVFRSLNYDFVRTMSEGFYDCFFKESSKINVLKNDISKWLDLDFVLQRSCRASEKSGQSNTTRWDCCDTTLLCCLYLSHERIYRSNACRKPSIVIKQCKTIYVF